MDSVFFSGIRDNHSRGNVGEFLRKKIPLKKPVRSEAALFKKRDAMACPPKPRSRLVQLAKREGKASRLPFSESKRDACAIFFEELIDACVLELYFPEEAAAKDLQFMDKTAGLLSVDAMLSSHSASARLTQRDEGVASTISDIENFVATAPSHPIRNQLLRLTADSPNLFAVIKQEGAV